MRFKQSTVNLPFNKNIYINDSQNNYLQYSLSEAFIFNRHSEILAHLSHQFKLFVNFRLSNNHELYDKLGLGLA